MSRYIDADALLEDVRKNSASYFADDFAREWVDRQPTADDRENVRGEWIDKKITIKKAHGMAYGRWSCSACKAKQPHRSNFCPNCGADMRGEEGKE